MHACRKTLVMVAWLMSCLPPAGLAAADAISITTTGDITQVDGIWRAGRKAGVLVVEAPAITGGRLNFELQLAPTVRRDSTDLVIFPTNAANLKLPAAARYTFQRDKEFCILTVHPMEFNAGKGTWGRSQGEGELFPFWQPEGTNYSRQKQAIVKTSGLSPRSWTNCWLQAAVEVDATTLTFWLQDRMVQRTLRPQGAGGPVVLLLAPGDQVRGLATEPLLETSRFLPVRLDLYTNRTASAALAEAWPTVEGIPFALTRDRRGILDLKDAQWTEWQRDPVDYYEVYDGEPVFLDDMRTPMLRLPVADYTAAHLLAVADPDVARSAVVTLRAGRYGWRGQVVQHDFAADVPRAGTKEKAALTTGDGPLFHVRLPMTDAFAQDLDDLMDVEITKEIRLAINQDDATRWRKRPLGLPSGVRIAAITFEKSPLQIRVTSAEAGHAFEEPAKPVFSVELSNITHDKQAYSLTAKAVHLDGTVVPLAAATGVVDAGAKANVSLALNVAKRGYYDVVIALADHAGALLLQRKTSFALLPPNTRKHRETSPFGTWDFYGAHFTPSDPDKLGPLYIKLGLHYGMFKASTEVLETYGVIYGDEPKIIGEKGLDVYEHALARLPGYTPPGLIFHENAISLPQQVRVPELFTDLPSYKLNEAEEANFKKLWDAAVLGAKAIRAKHPEAHLRFGNNALPCKEEFYRRQFPAELFDSGGNEAPSAGRPPESQPPDWVVNNASLWMDRQLLDAYGYRNKPVTQCYEVTFVNTSPGNVRESTQADYVVRHALHGLAWNLPRIKVGVIADMGNSYYFSSWGASGFCNRKPEMSVKPAFVAFATLTRVLDGATFVRDVATGSPSSYLLEFTRPDGMTVYPLWTVRGSRPVTLGVDGGAWTLIDDQANEVSLAVTNGQITVAATPTPVYLVGPGTISRVTLGDPAHAAAPRGKLNILSPLASMDEWQIETERNAELEHFNALCPRRPGKFVFEPVAGFEGKEHVLKVTPQPLPSSKPTMAMPMYVALAHKVGLPIPGTPTEVGLWVNGNSSWGRIIFEFKDASGQRWTSIGVESKRMAERYKVPHVSGWSADDGYGMSRISFDGWRYVSFPMPGNYPGEGYGWPANNQWKSEKDRTVRYPLTFTKLIVELPEKTLHLKDFVPAPRPEVYLKDLVVCEGPLRTLDDPQ